MAEQHLLLIGLDLMLLHGEHEVLLLDSSPCESIDDPLWLLCRRALLGFHEVHRSLLVLTPPAVSLSMTPFSARAAVALNCTVAAVVRDATACRLALALELAFAITLLAFAFALGGLAFALGFAFAALAFLQGVQPLLQHIDVHRLDAAVIAVVLLDVRLDVVLHDLAGIGIGVVLVSMKVKMLLNFVRSEESDHADPDLLVQGLLEGFLVFLHLSFPRLDGCHRLLDLLGLWRPQ